MVAHFTYLLDLYKRCYNNQSLRYRNIYMLGSRKSGKTLSVLELFVLLVLLKNVNIRIYIFRKNLQDIEASVWEELLNFFEYWNIAYSLNKMYRRISINKNKITFHALHDRSKNKKVKLSGLASNRFYKYTICFFEEAHEFTREDVADVKEAIRGQSERLYIYASNPWTSSHWLIKYCNSIMPFNENKMINEGYQLKAIHEEILDYSTYKINNLLSIQDYKQLEAVKQLNPVRAKTACYGLPSIEQGAIYSHAIGKVSKLLDTNLNMFQGGIDFGYAKDATALILIGLTSDNERVNIIDEYYHSNGENIIFKDNRTMAREIIKTIERNANKYQLFYRGITIYCDNSNYTMIELLNQMAQSKNYLWLQFRAVKKMKVSLRVGLQLNIMEENRLSVSKECVNFLHELAMARWDITKAEKKPVDADNHTQDAFHYAFSSWFYLLTKKINPYLRPMI